MRYGGEYNDIVPGKQANAMIAASDAFHAEAVGQIINPVARYHVSFDKETSADTTYFTLNQSVLDGPDLLATADDNPIQLWDTYDYKDYSDRLVKLEWSRSIEFPHTVQSALADITLNNYDDYFTPDSGSTISANNLPKRPARIYAGYSTSGVVPQLVGLTQEMPKIDDNSRTATYHMMDFLSEIAEQNLNAVIAMRDARTDEVLAKIVEQFGVLPSQYRFDTGVNVIPFVFFDKNTNAGEAIRKLVQAEIGRMWLDEMGVLRFQSRVNSPSEPVMLLDDYSVISIKPSTSAQMVNHVKITADIREVQEWQSVYTKTSSGESVSSDLWVVPAGGSYTWEASLSDPCYDVEVPTIGKNSAVSWFTARTSNGAEITSGVTCTGELSTNAYSMTFTNNNLVPVEIDEIELWGEPAKVIDVIDYDAYEDESVAKYGDHLLELTDNQFIQSYGQAEAFAKYLLYQYAFYNGVLELEVKGDVALQIGDLVTIRTERFSGTYMVDSLAYTLQPGLLTTRMTVHKYTTIPFFVLNASLLNGNNVLG